MLSATAFSPRPIWTNRRKGLPCEYSLAVPASPLFGNVFIMFDYCRSRSAKQSGGMIIANGKSPAQTNRPKSTQPARSVVAYIAGK